MTTNKLRFGICIVAGSGGIGSNLIEPLTRLLMFHPQGTWRILVVDGDSYEPKNRVRQLFDPAASNLNKAIATTKRLNFAPNLIPIDKYLNESTLYDLFSGLALYLDPNEPLLFVSCVDNHRSRNAFLQALDTHVPSYVFVNPSNGYETVQVSLHIKYKGDEMTVHPFDRYEDIARPTDHIPGGCQEEAPSTPQLLVANALAANGALMLVNSLLDGKPVYDELVGDVYKMQLKPQGKAIKFIA